VAGRLAAQRHHRAAAVVPVCRDVAPAQGALRRGGAGVMTAAERRLLLVGHGRMGRLVESLAPQHGFRVTGAVTSANANASDWLPSDVALDFSAPPAVRANADRLASRGTAIVIGTTGWQHAEEEVRGVAARAGIGVVAAPNFAVGGHRLLAVGAPPRA